MANTYDLELVQGERTRLGLRYRVNGVAQELAGWTFRSQARQRESVGADLILDLTEYMSVADDGVTIELDIPASATYAIPKVSKTAAWDLFIWPTSEPNAKKRLIQGSVTLDMAATALA